MCYFERPCGFLCLFNKYGVYTRRDDESRVGNRENIHWLWHPEESLSTRVEKLLNHDVPDKDIMYSWLVELHLEEYLSLFTSAGYDMKTVSKMTPEDLIGIGIKDPNHRKTLKAEIDLLNISESLLDYIPGSLDELLRLLGLEEYRSALETQGYSEVDSVTRLTWEDLEDFGIVKLGHQKRILLAIKKIKDIKAGKSFVLLRPYMIQTQVCIESPPRCIVSSNSCEIQTSTENVELDSTYYSFDGPSELYKPSF